MKKLISNIKKYKKDYLLLFIVVSVLFMAVNGDGFSDLAKKKFWWNAWSVIWILSIIASVLGWIYLWNKDKKANR